jgi:hypothetical protein
VIAEQWRPVDGFPGYEVSDQGRVRSLPRVVQHGDRTKRVHGCVLRPAPSGAGRHLAVTMVDEHRRKRTRYVHQLVLLTWVGPRPPGMEGCHGPAGIGDNGVANLRWDTHAANTLDSVADGTHNRARGTHCPAGHPKIEANWRGPRDRSCRACSEARKIIYDAVRRGRPKPEFRPLADARFALIAAAA